MADITAPPGLIDLQEGGGSGATSFLALTDTPSSYVGQAGLFVRVTLAEDGLEFVEESGLGNVVGPGSSVNNRLVTWDGTTGTLIQDASTITLTNALSVNSFNSADSITVESTGGDVAVIADAGSISLDALASLQTVSFSTNTDASIDLLTGTVNLDAAADINAKHGDAATFNIQPQTTGGIARLNMGANDVVAVEANETSLATTIDTLGNLSITTPTLASFNVDTNQGAINLTTNLGGNIVLDSNDLVQLNSGSTAKIELNAGGDIDLITNDQINMVAVNDSILNVTAGTLTVQLDNGGLLGGFQYAADYSSQFVDRSIPDVGFINTIIQNFIVTPGPVVDNRLVTWDGTSGQQVQDNTSITADGALLQWAVNGTIETLDGMTVRAGPTGMGFETDSNVGSGAFFFDKTATTTASGTALMGFLDQDTTLGGQFQLFATNQTPEATITSLFGTSLAVDSTGQDLYIFRGTAPANTGWVKLLTTDDEAPPLAEADQIITPDASVREIIGNNGSLLLAEMFDTTSADYTDRTEVLNAGSGGLQIGYDRGDGAGGIVGSTRFQLLPANGNAVLSSNISGATLTSTFDGNIAFDSTAGSFNVTAGADVDIDSSRVLLTSQLETNLTAVAGSVTLDSQTFGVQLLAATTINALAGGNITIDSSGGLVNIEADGNAILRSVSSDAFVISNANDVNLWATGGSVITQTNTVELQPVNSGDVVTLQHNDGGNVWSLAGDGSDGSATLTISDEFNLNAGGNMIQTGQQWIVTGALSMAFNMNDPSGLLKLDSANTIELEADTSILFDAPQSDFPNNVLFGDKFASFEATYSFTPPNSGDIFNNYLGSYSGSGNNVIDIYIRQTGSGEGGQSHFKVSRTTGGPEPVFEVWDSSPTDVQLYWSNDGGGAYSLYFADLATASGSVSYNVSVVTQEGVLSTTNPNTDDTNIFAVRTDNIVRYADGDMNAPQMSYGDAIDPAFTTRHQFYGGIQDFESQVTSVYEVSDFGTAVGDVITLTPGVYEVRQSIVMGTTRLVADGTGSVFLKGQVFGATALTYTGSDTFFTADDAQSNFSLIFSQIAFVMAGANSTAYNIGADWLFASSEWALRALAANVTLGAFDGTGRSALSRFSVGGFTNGATFNDVRDISIAGAQIEGSANPNYIGYSFTGDTQVTSLSRIFSELIAGQALLYIDPVVTGPFNISSCDSGDGDFYWLGGETGTITAAADVVIAATTVNSVTDNGGIARFNYTPVTTYYVGQELNLTGFTNYTNGFFRITATDGSTYVELGVDFNGDDTGVLNADVVRLTATNTLAEATSVLITDTISYNGGNVAFNVTPTTFDISAVFVATETGTYSSNSIDFSDPRVFAFGNTGSADSQVIAALRNDVDTITTFGAINTFTPLLSTGTILGDASQRFIQENEDEALSIRYIGLEDVTVTVTGLVAVTPGNGQTRTYTFRLLVNGVQPDDDVDIPLGSTQQFEYLVPLEWTVNVSFGDLITIEAANSNNGGGSGNQLTTNVVKIAVSN